MDLVIEHRPGDVRVILQGPADSAELQRILSLLQNHSDKLWCLDEERNTVALSAGQVLWAETVDDKLFVLHRAFFIPDARQPGRPGTALGTVRFFSVRKIHRN